MSFFNRQARLDRNAANQSNRRGYAQSRQQGVQQSRQQSIQQNRQGFNQRLPHNPQTNHGFSGSQHIGRNPFQTPLGNPPGIGNQAQGPRNNAGRSVPDDPRVNYEPLSDADMAMLGIKKNSQPADSQIPQNQVPQNQANKISNLDEGINRGQQNPNNPPSGNETFFNAGPELLEKLALAAQNASNGSVFYGRLSDMSPTDDVKDTLNKISVQNKKMSTSFFETHKTFSGGGCEIKDVDIINAENFYHGVSIAIAEETKNLSEICDIYEEMVDERQLHKINLMLHRKISDLSFLNALRAKYNGLF